MVYWKSFTGPTFLCLLFFFFLISGFLSFSAGAKDLSRPPPICLRLYSGEHLLAGERPRDSLETAVIIVKGSMGECEKGGGGVPGAGGRGPLFPREWGLVIGREDGKIRRFMADGVDLIEPGAGELCSGVGDR